MKANIISYDIKEHTFDSITACLNKHEKNISEINKYSVIIRVPCLTQCTYEYQTLAICRLSSIKNRAKCDTHHFIIH